MRYSLFKISCLLLISFIAQAQTELKLLPPNINQPSINNYAPFISGDGQTIIYLSDYTDDGHHSMHWATKKTVSTWNDGKEINKLINRPTLNFRGGYSLSFDGDQLFFTSQKSGLGGFDIWSSNRRGNDWEAPKNLGNTINTRTNEGSPMLSPDGQYLYFMRCEQMKPYGGASGCKILVSENKYNGWSEPVELPANINTGNSQTPRILADGETLIFASDAMGGKGGLDLYQSKKTGENEWTDPVALDFANTADDDVFISIPAKGRYMYRAMKGQRDYDLFQVLIPDEFQPKGVMRVQGNITDEAGNPVDAHLTIFNITDRDRLWNERVGDKGEFAIVLKEGAVYDLAVEHPKPGYMYFSKLYDLEELGPRDKERLRIKLSPIKVDQAYPLDILFKPYSHEPKEISLYELRRLGDFIRLKPEMKVEIMVEQQNYREDTVKNDPDLTEMREDTLYYDEIYVKQNLLSDRHKPLYDWVKGNWPTRSEVIFDSIYYSVNITEDSLLITEVIPRKPALPPDSLVTDSTAVSAPPPLSDTLNASYPLTLYELKTIYHNNRTEKQAEAIQNFLLERGVKSGQIMFTTSHKENEGNEYTDNKPDVAVTLTIKEM